MTHNCRSEKTKNMWLLLLGVHLAVNENPGLETGGMCVAFVALHAKNFFR